MSRHQVFCEQLCSLHSTLTRSFQRRIVVLTGTYETSLSIIDYLGKELAWSSCLFVTDRLKTEQSMMDKQQLSAYPMIPAHKLKHRLGQEVETLIWDGFSGLNPNALGIASGLLKGGGIFFLLLPDFEQLIQQGDPDYLRMCADHQIFERCYTFFLQRLVKHLQRDPTIWLYEVDHPENLQCEVPDLPTASAAHLPTVDQEAALEAIVKVAKGHRYRPLVLQADRGRGKSSVLGMAAAQLYQAYGYKIAISAPDKTTCQAAFQHYRRTIEASAADDFDLNQADAALQFIPIDQLLEKCHQFQLIMVDEAAALPSHLLQMLLKSHPRLVFATTLHGYEGHGQGFAIRFRQALDSTTPQWKTCSLRTPIRWLEKDPLEQWFFRFLLLNASLVERPTLGGQVNAKQCVSIDNRHLANITVEWLSQAELARQEPLFEAVFALLVSAHYQTKPSDIRLILDHPQIHIAVAFASAPASTEGANLVGVMLLLEEGGLPENLASAVISGTRRLRGHLFPQALCASSGNEAFLVQRSYRITRIAVRLDARQQGVGSALLAKAHELAKQHRIDSLSTSFGLRPELLSFWHKNHFEIVKLGLHADGASGNQSVMLMRPLSAAAIALGNSTCASFAAYFLFNLSRLYQFLDYQECLAILNLLVGKLPVKPAAQSTANVTLRAFAFGHRSFEETNQVLFEFVVASLVSPHWQKLEPKAAALLVMKVLQGHEHDSCRQCLNLTGKKDIEQGLRTALQVLLGS